MRGVLIGLLMLLGLGNVAQAQLQTPAAVNGCIYIASLPTLVNGQRSAFLCDVNGRLLVAAAVATSINIGATLGGCATSGGILYNNGGVLGCSQATVSANGGLFPVGTQPIAWGGRSRIVSPSNGLVSIFAADGVTPSAFAAGAINSTATISTAGYTVSTLPSGTIGMRTYVTDQAGACPVTGAALTGGGSAVCPVFYNGTAWVGG